MNPFPPPMNTLKKNKDEVKSAFTIVCLVLLPMPIIIGLAWNLIFETEWSQWLITTAPITTTVLFALFIAAYLPQYKTTSLLKKITTKDLSKIQYAITNFETEFNEYLAGVTFQGRELYQQELEVIIFEFARNSRYNEDNQQKENCKKLYSCS